MKSESDKKNNFCFVSGQSEPVGAGSNGYQKSITLVNAKGIPLRLHGFILRYKNGLEKTGFELKSSSIDKGGSLFEGFTPLSCVGSPIDNPAWNMFPIPGKKPILANNDQITISFHTFSEAILKGDIGITAVFEQIETV